MSYDQKEKTIKKGPNKICIEPQQMGTTFSTKLLTSEQLAKMINAVFSRVSPDFEGAIISLSKRQKRIVAQLVFSDNPRVTKDNLEQGEFKIIQPLNASTDGHRHAAQLMYNYNRRNSTTKRFELTSDAEEVLEEFIPHLDINDSLIRNGHDNKVNWDRAYYEQSEQMMYGSDCKIYSLIPFSIEYFLSKVYGSKAENGGHYSYELQYIRPIAPIGNFPNGNIMPIDNIKFLLAIFKMEDIAIRHICEEAGMPVMQNSLGIIRAQ